MDINLGTIELTDKQVSNLNSLKTNKIKGFSFWYDSKEVIAVVDGTLSENKINELKADIASLPDEYSKEYKESKFNIDDFMIELEEAVGESKVDDLSDQLRRLERYGKRKAFGKIKRLGERLVNKGRLTQQEFDGIQALFLSKGIDLGDY